MTTLSVNLQRGETILIVKRTRALAGLPAIEGVVSDVHTKAGRIYAISAKVSKAAPTMFPMREVCVGKDDARSVTNAIINDAEDDAFIAYAHRRRVIDHARHQDHTHAIATAKAITQHPTE